MAANDGAERRRLQEAREQQQPWRLWGPYLTAATWCDNPTWQRFVAVAWQRGEALLPGIEYEREGSDLAKRGPLLDVPAWHAHAFEVSAVPA